jgi:GxxExxY protein
MLFEEQLSEQVIGAAIEVHKHLGPGLMESVYEECLCKELQLRGIPFERQFPIPVTYKTLDVGCAYRANVVVDKKIILELKAVENINSLHKAQLLTYMRLTGMKIGLLLNFNVPALKDGITRLVL